MLLPLIAEIAIYAMSEDNHSATAVFLHNFVEGKYNQQFINISLGIVAGTILLSVIASIVISPKEETEEEKIVEHLDKETDDE